MPQTSLHRKLPLLITALLSSIVAAVSWSAYRQIEGVLISASGTQLTGVSQQIAGMLTESLYRRRADVRQLASDTTLGQFLARPTGASRAAAEQRLARALAREPQPVSYSLWSRNGERLLAVGPSALTSAASTLPSPPASQARDRRAPGAAWMGSLVPADTGVAFGTVAPLLSQGRDTIGFLVEYRQIRRGPSTDQLSKLIGPGVRLLIGNADGTLWTDLSKAVPGPPSRVTPGTTLAYTDSTGSEIHGVAASIAQTPWVIWVQTPRAAVLASATPFVFRVTAIGALFIALGALAAWRLSRGVTAPLTEITRAAEDLASGDYDRRVAVTRRDELGRLALSFNSMAAQVSEASRELHDHASELEILNVELETANDDLRASEERYRLLIEGSHEGICAVDATGVITYANGRLAVLLARTTSELTGQSIFAYMEPASAFEARTRFARHVRGIAETREAPYRRIDGTTLWMNESVSPLFDESGSFTGALFMLSDVSERHEAQARLERSERHFRALTENAPDMIAVLDGDGLLRYASPALLRCAGVDDQSLIGTPATSRIHPEDLHRTDTALAEALARPNHPIRVEYRYRHLEHGWRHLSSVATNLLADPAVRGIVVNSRDVSDQRALESQLLQAQKMEAVGQLAGGIAHDFNNLLSVMTSYTGILLSELPADSPMRDDMEEVRRAAERAAALTRQLLAFSRRQVLQPQVLDLNEVVRDLERMLLRVLPEDVRLAAVLSPRLGRVNADPGQLEQVIVNLAVNARDAMPGGGILTLETSNVDLDEQYCRSHAELSPGPYVLLTVSDTGVGMDAVTQARAFDPFFTTKDVGKGTGLGLSTVYGIVKQSGGHVAIYSEPGVGTTLKVYLPRVDAAATRRTPSGSHTLVLPGRETVLLVEDDVQVRLAARRVLESAGYHVLEASSASEALRVAEASDVRIDLLLTDMVMPEMSGRELAILFRERYPTAVTVFMSGYSEEAVMRQGMLEPQTVFISKPFTPHTLSQRLREALDADFSDRVA